MDSNAKRSAIIGGGFGFIFSVVVALAVNFCGSKCEITQKVGLFIGSVPAYLAAKINSSDPFVTVVFIIYWILVGGVIGFISSLKTPKVKIIMALLVIILVIAHYVAMTELSKDISRAVQALGDLF
jgi:uncharacterized membrane protein YfhO